MNPPHAVTLTNLATRLNCICQCLQDANGDRATIAKARILVQRVRLLALLVHRGATL